MDKSKVQDNKLGQWYRFGIQDIENKSQRYPRIEGKPKLHGIIPKGYVQ